MDSLGSTYSEIVQCFVLFSTQCEFVRQAIDGSPGCFELEREDTNISW